MRDHSAPPYQVENPKPLLIALDPAFEFRKTKEYFLDPRRAPPYRTSDPSVVFERNYRMFGRSPRSTSISVSASTSTSFGGLAAKLTSGATRISAGKIARIRPGT
jgi:hypothetical protein